MSTAAEQKTKVFVLGDSRTGTMNIHRFLLAAQYQSIHYFFKESGVTEPAHTDYDGNWERLKTFIETSGYNAFSDYPTRIFFRNLFAEYPEAQFILTLRKDGDTWRKSMRAFAERFGIEFDLDALTASYHRLNDAIRALAAETGVQFLELCVDDEAAENDAALATFLGLGDAVGLGYSAGGLATRDKALWSSRVTLYESDTADFLSDVKQLTHSSKAMLSEFGWVYLINDSSDFLDFCYNAKVWSEQARWNARSVLQNRRAVLGGQGAAYLKFAAPEKQIVYPQFLPKIFHGKPVSDQRPAMLMRAMDLDCFSYPDAVLRDARSYGHLYFRGDSHANWLGAYFLYHHVIDTLNADMQQNFPDLKGRQAIGLKDLTPSLASYGGDIFTQLDETARGHLQEGWGDLALPDRMEYLIRYMLPDSHRKAVRKPCEPELLDLLGERETFRFSHPDKTLPRAVIFRDSTSDFIVDLLAEHFSESLFIWHKGRVYDDVIAQEKPDVVLHIMAERFLAQYEHWVPFDTLGLPQPT